MNKAIYSKADVASKRFDMPKTSKVQVNPMEDPRAGQCESMANEIPARIEILRDRAAYALDRINLLGVRLNSVLRSEPSCDKQDDSAASKTPLGNAIGDAIAIVGRIISEISDIHEKLEL